MSVDPLIQSPTSTQSVNPYSYIMNNPLAGTDPTGYAAEEIEKKIKVSVTGSNIKQTVTATAKSNGSGGVTITFSGGNGAARSAAMNAVAGKLSGQGFQVSNVGSLGDNAAKGSAGSGNIPVNINNEGLDKVSQSDLSPDEIKSRQEKARKLIKGVSFSNMAGQDPFGKEKQFFEDLDAIAITDQFHEFTQLYDGKGININLCTKCVSQSQDRTSQGLNVIRLNVSEKVYSRAEGDNSYVSITGSRLLAHELAHAFKNHKTGSTLQNLTNESAASKYENIIMKQTGSSNVGVRAAYEGIENLPAGARILK
jgi:hypothetical protein